MTLDALAERWFRQVVEVRCAGQAHAIGDLRLPGWLRGGFGRALMRGASEAAIADRPCPFEPPCALDVLFRSQGRVRRDIDLPPPFVIAVDARGGDAVFHLTVFGFACDWIEAAADAFVAGIRSTAPPALGGGALRPTGRSVDTFVGVEAAAATEAVILEFATPVTLRDPKALRGDGRRLLMAMGNRVSALARFQDCAVETDWRELATRAERVQVDGDSLRWVDWEQGSKRAGGRDRPMSGQIGHLVLRGDLRPFAALLALGATCHVGSHATLGQGRFRTIDTEGVGRHR